MRFKDANECLMAGVLAAVMEACLVNAQDFAPKQVVAAAEYEQEFYDEWFGKELEPGLALPFEFPFKIRPAELTVWTGIEKSGKTTLLSFVLVALLAQGERALVASFEVRPRRTLKKMSRQVFGGLIFDGDQLKACATEAERERYQRTARENAGRAFAWMSRNLWLYDHTGIGRWRTLGDDMRWARRRYGITQFVIDNFMRLGIPKDDYAQQADAVTYFTALAMELEVHIHLVVHQNKGEKQKDGKRSVSGAFEIIANAHNIVEVVRDVSKGEQMSDLYDKHAAGTMEDKEFGEKRAALETKPDGKFILHAQRDGEQQNASRYLWFLWKSQQYSPYPPNASQHGAVQFCAPGPGGEQEDLPTSEPEN